MTTHVRLGPSYQVLMEEAGQREQQGGKQHALPARRALIAALRQHSAEQPAWWQWQDAVWSM